MFGSHSLYMHDMRFHVENNGLAAQSKVTDPVKWRLLWNIRDEGRLTMPSKIGSRSVPCPWRVSRLQLRTIYRLNFIY